MKWTVLSLLAGLGALALGTYLLFTGSPVVGTMVVLLGLLLGGGSVVLYGQHRGDPRAGEGSRPLVMTEKPLRGPYLLVGELVMALGAAIGLLYVIFAPVGGRSSTDTPLEARTFGFIVLGACVIGAIWMLVRARRSRV
ncbi:hypothetical protein [Actinophytocola sp.]|uniref:hypothetical protein n=1 Tax=Actinophytocola sp. TaxID=1872138 RepID=UPI002DDD5BEE|nr:hypothetical protein [Actinophytocola sp.]